MSVSGCLPLLSRPEIRRLLDTYGLAPRKSAGQNFVSDPNTVRKIVREAGVGADDVVIEIGPGLGSLTAALAAEVRRVIAVEIDAGFVRVLTDQIAEHEVTNVEVVHADAMGLDLGELVGGEPAHVVANLPYNLATPLVMHALETGPSIVAQFVMVQREVGERWAADPGDSLYSGVSAKLALVADVAVVSPVPRAVFFPVPNVDSVTVRITRGGHAPPPDEVAEVVTLIDTAFGQRRKTVRNSLKAHHDADRLAAAFTASGIDPGARPETLDATAFRSLARALRQ